MVLKNHAEKIIGNINIFTNAEYLIDNFLL